MYNWKKLGAVGLTTHYTIYFSWLTGVYLLVKNDCLETSTIQNIMDIHNQVVTFFGFEPKNTIDSSIAATTAWVSAKLAEPIRLPLTYFITKQILKRIK